MLEPDSSSHSSRCYHDHLGAGSRICSETLKEIDGGENDSLHVMFTTTFVGDALFSLHLWVITEAFQVRLLFL